MSEPVRVGSIRNNTAVEDLLSEESERIFKFKRKFGSGRRTVNNRAIFN